MLSYRHPTPKARGRHDMTVLKKAIDEVGRRGRKVIDARTRVGRALLDWRAGLVSDLGGQEALSAQQLAIVDIAVRTKLLLDSVDAWLLRQDSIIDKRRRQLFPIVQQRTALADAMARYLGTLGLERRAKNVTTLRDVLEGGKS